MHFILQLAIPLIAPMSFAVASPMPELSIQGLWGAVEDFALTYLAFSAPHLIWLAVTGQVSASEDATLGGLAGLNALLVGVCVLVFRSSSPEAANGWFIYFLGAPFAIAAGAIVWRRYVVWES